MEKLFWQLYNCDTEEEVDKIVKTNQLLSDFANWKVYGSKRYGKDFGNFSTFENQQNNPIPALIEKITNSIDAILLKECIARKIDPKSDLAPKTMSEAVENFFDIKDGDFSEIIKDERRQIAENIQVIASGDLKTPSITVYDNGEGQLPHQFEKRFASRFEKGKVPSKLMMGNKTRVTIDDRDKVERITSFSIEDKNIPIDVIVFKHDTEHREYIKNKSIVFTQNGQVHGSDGKSFISQQLGFPLLKDTMLINVDCTNINTNFRGELFMANRTQLKDSRKKEELLE